MLRNFILIGWLLLNTLWADVPLDSLPKGIETSVEKVRLSFQGQSVEGRLLTVRSILPHPIDSAWAWVQTSALLQYVVRGRLRFLPENGAFPARWEQGDTVVTRMRIHGFLPFGGRHRLHIVEIDSNHYRLATEEWDRTAKIWNHRIQMEPLGPKQTLYQDQIIIYGGWQTGLITWWAKGFYRHRQRRWQVVNRSRLPSTM